MNIKLGWYLQMKGIRYKRKGLWGNKKKINYSTNQVKNSQNISTLYLSSFCQYKVGHCAFITTSYICIHIYIYIYIYIYVHGASNKFPDFFCTGIWNCRRLLKIQYVIAIHLIRWLTNFYDFTFKSTAKAAIGIQPTKSWLSQLVNFKNPIWHFRKMICNKIVF